VCRGSPKVAEARGKAFPFKTMWKDIYARALIYGVMVLLFNSKRGLHGKSKDSYG
jgi:hypothetical protein